MICDYFLVRRGQLNLNDLYRRDGIYEYSTASIPKPSLP